MKDATKATVSYTPGPWLVEGPFGPVDGIGDRHVVADAKYGRGGRPGDCVALIQRGYPQYDGERAANARLIAAAPEMRAWIETMMTETEAALTQTHATSHSGAPWFYVRAVRDRIAEGRALLSKIEGR